MSGYVFADKYKLAGFSPASEVISLRQAVVDKLTKSIDFAKILDLTRLYFGLQVPNNANWFRDAFAENDTSFTMVSNEREASVLSYCLLMEAMENGETAAGLAILTTYACGNRKPLLLPDLIDFAVSFLKQNSIDNRNIENTDSGIIKHAASSKVSLQIDALNQAPDWAKAGEVIKLSSNEAMTAHKNLAIQTVTVFNSLIDEKNILREEVNMLWWYIGGWCDSLNSSFNDLGLGIAALLAGIELADISNESTGPVAAPAILRRVLFNQGREFSKVKLKLSQVIETVPEKTFEIITQSQIEFTSASDICPVLTAMKKNSEIGGNGAWLQAFQKTSYLEASNVEFEPLELAIQIYQEALLLKELN